MDHSIITLVWQEVQICDVAIVMKNPLLANVCVGPHTTYSLQSRGCLFATKMVPAPTNNTIKRDALGCEKGARRGLIVFVSSCRPRRYWSLYQQTPLVKFAPRESSMCSKKYISTPRF